MIVALLCALLAAEEPAATPSPTADQLRFFETRVRPVLAEHCWKCHGSAKQWAGLRLDSRDAMLRGGDSGPAIVPGKPAESLLVRAVRHEDDNLKMPQEGKLAEDQIASLERWIESGANFPDAPRPGSTSRDPNHWAFQPVLARIIPEVGNRSWPRTAIDSFVLAGLESAHLAPVPETDKRTWIRRLAFDLTGLPPSPEEVDAFLSDERPDADDRLIDRLLASPAYGERWGRHWLDVARYADSNGLDENVAHGNAWRYRDYVVRSWNQDKPFDRFVVEQLAGDLLPAADEPQRHENLIATGFLVVGPKVLAEVDQSKMQMDIVDEQIETTGRAFLGLTLGCARCHDHKFDPISTADYYGLAGVFKSTRTMETYTKVAKWHEAVLPSPTATAMQAEYDAQLAARKQAISDYVAQADEQVRKTLAADAKPPEKLETLYPEATKAELAKLREALASLEKTPPDIPSAMSVTEDKVLDLAIHVRGNPLKLGDVVPRRVPQVVRGPSEPRFSEQESGRMPLAQWLVHGRNPLTGRVMVNRVWRWHFGKGLVRSTDNFGLLGERPTHPELLDWLARRFVTDGWSVKTLHRLILNSQTYHASSVTPAPTLAEDPENRLWGRMEMRRLDAEEVRDALLAVSGQLDATLGGSLLKVKNRGYLFDHTSIDLTDYTSRRRSLYLPVIRNNVFDLFQLLDFPDPAVPKSDRAATVVAPQALLMMNSEFVMQSSAEFAGHLSAIPDRAERMSRMYQLAYGRAITTDERLVNEALLEAITGYLANSSVAGFEPDQTKRERAAWNSLCHVVVAANEFIYLK